MSSINLGPAAKIEACYSDLPLTMTELLYGRNLVNLEIASAKIHLSVVLNKDSSFYEKVVNMSSISQSERRTKIVQDVMAIFSRHFPVQTVDLGFEYCLDIFIKTNQKKFYGLDIKAQFNSLGGQFRFQSGISSFSSKEKMVEYNENQEETTGHVATLLDLKDEFVQLQPSLGASPAKF